MANDYEAPPYGSSADRVLGWYLEAKQTGDAWLASQKPAIQWPGAIELMSGGDDSPMVSEMSNTQYPKAKRIARELVASLANFEYEGEFKVLWDNDLYDSAHVLTQLDRHWYEKTFANEAHRACLQHAVVQGTGYWGEEWDKHYWGPGKGDIKLTALSPSDVTFVQLPKDHDIQRAYVVLIRYELPLNLAKRIYAETNPTFAASLVPDRDQPGWLAKGLQKVQQFLSPALRVAGRTRQEGNASFPTVDIYHAYTMDAATNNSMAPVTMGKGNWQYTVPAVGDPIPQGVKNPLTGAEMTLPAAPSDCLLFPLRRLTIFSATGVAYDDSSPWWHGDVPVARARFNDWPWEALGGSLVADVRSLEGALVALMRGVEDSAAARLDPPAIYDDTMVAGSWAKAFNPRLAGVRAAAPLAQGDPIKFPVNPAQYDVPSWIQNVMDGYEQKMDYITGVRDLVAMAKARQIPGADTLEKLMEMAGPIVQDMVRALEKPLTQLGEWRKAYYLQFYNETRIIDTVGPDEESEQLAYSTFISDALKELLKKKSFKFQPGMIQGNTGVQTREKVKRLVSEFRYEVTESGINEIHRMSTKLFYLQLMKEGFPISWWTFAKIARVPNFGPPPAGTNTEMERWIAQQHIKTDLAAELQQEMTNAQQPPGGAPQEGAPPASGEGPGRPQTYQKPLRIQQKDGGTRSTVVSS